MTWKKKRFVRPKKGVPHKFEHVYKGWLTIGGKKYFYKSKQEANYALFLQFLKDKGDIKDWEYEPDTFYFDGIKRGVTNYTPDFKIFENDGRVRYVIGIASARS